MKLGKLEKVELRNVWPDEAKDFTPWLAQEDNISLLSEAIGLDSVSYTHLTLPTIYSV